MDESVLLSLPVQLRNMHNKTIIRFGFRMTAIIIKASVCVILSLRFRQMTQTLAFDNYRYHAQPNPIIVNYFSFLNQW